MITILNTKKLKGTLIENTLSDNHAFVYFFIILLYDYIGFTFGYLSLNGQELNVWVKTNIIAALILTCIGVLYVFWCNGGAKGEKFFHRYFSLSVVVGIKFAILMIALPTIIDIATSGKAYELFPWLGSAIFVSLNVLMFVFVGRHIKMIANSNSTVTELEWQQTKKPI